MILDHFCKRTQLILPGPEHECPACTGEVTDEELEDYRRKLRGARAGAMKRELWIPVPKEN